jgi:hypothetical protein
LWNNEFGTGYQRNPHCRQGAKNNENGRACAASGDPKLPTEASLNALAGRSEVLNGAYERVPLAASAELQHPVRIEVDQRDEPCLGLDHRIVDARTAAADQPSRLAIGSGQPGAAEQL